MGVKRKAGETPGQIPAPAEEEEDEEASAEREWRRKLQAELEDEWQEALGRFEDDAYRDAQEPESFSAWADRLAQEHARRCQQRAAGPEHGGRRREARRQPREPAGAEEDEPRESRAQRAREARGDPGHRGDRGDRGHRGDREHRGHREHRKDRGDREHRGHREHRRDRGPEPARAAPAQGPLGGGEAGSGRLWRFGDVPWPCPGAGDPEAMAAALLAGGPPSGERGALRRYLRAQQVRWHPDRFLQRFRSQIEPRELGRVVGTVTALAQALNRRAEALK